MKKFLFILNLFFVTVSISLFIVENKDQAGVHAVSQSIAKEEDLTSTGAEVVSIGYANIEIKKTEDELKDLYPQLNISGDLKDGRMDLIKALLLDLPADKLQNLYNLKITQIKGTNRGLGGANMVIINDYELSDEEFISVLVHELGHAVDLGGIQGSPVSKKSAFNDGPNPIYTNDLSLLYYAYSWDDTSKQNNTAEHLDFVSGYAMTDPFEDFAESFTYYYLHNYDFKVLAQNNAKLALKYSYIRDYVFDGKELQTGVGESNPNKRVWDITKLAIAI